MSGTAGTTGRLGDQPGFWSTWTASTVSGFGNYVTSLAVGVLIVLTLDGTAADVGLVNAARWTPYLVLGLLAGVLVDRVRRRPLLVGADLGRAVVLAAIPALAALDRLGVGTLMALLAGYGLLSLLHDAAFQASVPRLVPRRLLIAANARLDQSDAVAQASGPALAGGLVALVGAPLAVLVDAASFVVSGLLLARVRFEDTVGQRRSLREVPGEIRAGLRWVYRHPTLTPQALAAHGWFLCTALVGAVVTPYALLTLGLGPLGLGLSLAAAGVGALAGSLASVTLGRRFGAGRVVVACQVSAAAAWALAALATPGSPGWLLFGAGQFVLGLGMGASNAQEMGFRQSITPDALQGRANATMRSINRAMVVVGAPLGGFLGDALGFRTLLWIAVAGFSVVAVGLGLSRFRTVRLDDDAFEAG